MKAAFSVWNERIAPVFDVARQVLLVEADSGIVMDQSRLVLPDDFQSTRAVRLSEFGIDTLVCGAISRPLHMMVESYGIHVVSFLAGGLSVVVDAWLRGALEDGQFAMPGCCGHGRRRFRAEKYIYKEEYPVEDQKYGGRGAGGGRGQGRGGRRLGRMDGPLAEGPVGFCICPKCGFRESHQKATPCVQKQCPQCGTALVRQ